MMRKTSVKAVSRGTKDEKCKFVSLSDINGILMLKIKEDEKDVIFHRGNSKSDQDWRKILKIFFDTLDTKEIDELRLFGIKHRCFKLAKLNKKEIRVSSIIFDQSTELNSLFDIIPLCSILKHVTLRGCTKYPYEKLNYAVRVHYSEVNSFDTMDFVCITQSLFRKDPGNPSMPKFQPSKLVLKPYRFDTEIFVRYHLTPNSLADLTTSIVSEGGFRYQGEWMVYKMNLNEQLMCKCGINGVYCVVLPAGCDESNHTPLEKFVWDSKNYDIAELLYEPEEVNDRRDTRIEWSSFPEGIKLMCIDKMPFKTRMNLRSTCHAEKALVDSSDPYFFKFVKVEHLTYSDGSQSLSVVAQNTQEILHIRSERWIEHKKHDEKKAFDLTVSAVKHILKFCRIDAMFLYPGAREEGMNHLQEELVGCTPFRISTFFSNILSPNIQFFLIENCHDSMNMIYLRITKNFTPKKYFDIPQIINSKCLQVHLDKPGSDPSMGPRMLVTKWIGTNADIGKKAVFAIFKHTFLTEIRIFAGTFSNRVISKNDEMVLLRTNDEAKRVLLHIYYDHDDYTYVTCRVISSELKEDEYELDERPWVGESELSYDFQQLDEEEDDEIIDSFE